MGILWLAIGVLFISLDLCDVVHSEPSSTTSAPGPAEDASPFCDSHYVCEQSDGPNATMHEGQCFCDDLCPAYNDCCLGKSLETQVETHVNGFVSTSSCQRLGQQHIYVVSQCPGGYPAGDISGYCEDVPDRDETLKRLPVTETQHGVTFKNIYCALCHGYSIGDIVFWTIDVECMMTKKYNKGPKSRPAPNEDVIPALNSTVNATYDDVTKPCLDYKYKFLRPLHSLPSRKCLAKLTDTCIDGWLNDTIRSKCERGPRGTVYLGLFGYRNIYCARCNGLKAHRDMCDQPPNIIDIIDKDPRPPHLMSVSLLLDFNSRSMTVRDQSLNIDRNCEPDSVYDIITDSCLRVICRQGRILTNGKCVSKRIMTDALTNYETRYINKANTTEESCALIKVGDSGHHVFPNSTLYLNRTGDMYGVGDYHVMNSSVYICISDFTEHKKEYVHQSQGILCLVGHVISILSLFVLIFFYTCIKSLRTLPGKCLLCLSCSLAAAQSSFIIGTFVVGVRVVCDVIAILTHLGYLLSFFWMNVMAFDVFITFRNQFVTASSSGKKFILYTCYTILFPICIVGLAVLSENTDLRMPKPTYGRPFCWIGQGDALLYYFVIPIGTLLCLNTIFFLLAVYHICRASTQSQLEKSPNANRRRLLLYVKLSTIMGLTWIFGYIALIKSLDIFWYLFIIFNSSQGLFIALAFLCNRKVSRLLHQRLGCSKPHSPSPSHAFTRATLLDARASPKVRILTHALLDKDKRHSPESARFPPPAGKKMRLKRVSGQTGDNQMYL